MPNKATIEDIALRAKVGRGTVSRVLNNHPNVSETTREKVLKAIAELDYRPSFAARHMRTQRSHLIGFLTDEVASTPYAGAIIQGAQDAAWEENRILLVVNVGRNIAITEAAVEALLERDVEGIIYAAMYHRAIVVPENIREVPVVLANCFVTDRSLPSVVPDEFNGGRLATEALLAKGHQRIGFINVNTLTPGIPAAVGRLEGYKAALQSYGISFDADLVRFGKGDPESGYRYCYELMSQKHPPTAIFCGNDRTAMGTYNALRELGQTIPEDIAIISFDNQELIATALKPDLTTMQLPHYEMGAWAANYLFQQNLDESLPSPIQKILDCPLVERSSI